MLAVNSDASNECRRCWRSRGQVELQLARRSCHDTAAAAADEDDGDNGGSGC